MFNFPNQSEYRRITYDEYDKYYKNDWDYMYDMLVGPDNFYCLLTELEDRCWCRDLRDVVNKLNEQHKEILRLKNEIRIWQSNPNNYRG